MLRLFVDFLLFLIFFAFLFSMSAVILVYALVGFFIMCGVAFYRGWKSERP